MGARLVLFDIDGTLIRTGGAGVRAFARVADRLYGIPDGVNGLRFHGRTDGAIVSEFLRAHALPDTPSERQRFLDAYVFLLDEALRGHSGELCPGVAALMQSVADLEAPPVMGLLTGNIRLGAGLKLAAHGLAESFVLGAFGDDHPDRNELARIAMARGSAHFGSPLSGDDVVVVGDTRADIECAQAIGARCVAVATGGDPMPDLLEHSPSLALESLDGVSWDRLLTAGELEGRPVDWESLYQAGDTRWDHGAPAPGLEDFLAAWPAGLERGGRVLVPGCGRGHDALAWAAAGFRVSALDLSATAIAAARRLVPPGLPVTFRVGDFLRQRPRQRVDWLFEHTLFCAIPPAQRDAYVRAVERWVRPGGHFLAVHYLQPRDAAGPPFGVSVAEVRRRFESGFERVREWVPRSHPYRCGRERAFLWRRRFNDKALALNS
ncbi:MAG: methyltransferase domain-containing protein [Verrucomicrobiae bacterium]|nr:methyltransferase domain-containing protein [Verrucomicrobiae bacterium]